MILGHANLESGVQIWNHLLSPVKLWTESLTKHEDKILLYLDVFPSDSFLALFYVPLKQSRWIPCQRWTDRPRRGGVCLLGRIGLESVNMD